MKTAITNKRLIDEDFLKERQEVLSVWPTGKEVDLDEAIEYHKRMPRHKILPERLARAKQEGEILVMPMTGKATVEETIADDVFAEKSGADIIFVISDAYTRKLNLTAAEAAIEQSKRLNKSTLNGYPFINHGVKQSRRIVEAVDRAFLCNANNDEDGRMLAEIAFASGWTDAICHDLRDLITHGKNYPADRRIHNNQYVCRLAGYYTERGAPIEMHVDGHVATYTPPSMGMSLAILQSLTAAEQGVKHLSLLFDVSISLNQNVAGLRVLRRLAEEYIHHRFNHKDVIVSISGYPWQYEYPRELFPAAALASWICAISILAPVDWVFIKSLEEAVMTPSKEANGHSIQIYKWLLRTLKGQRLPESEDLKAEEKIIEAETRAIIEKTLELGDGDPAIGRLAALATGVIDAPFSPYAHLKGKVLPIRDAGGAIRWLEFGNLPFSREIIEYNVQKIAEREKAEKAKADIDMVIKDIGALAEPVVKEFGCT